VQVRWGARSVREIVSGTVGTVSVHGLGTVSGTDRALAECAPGAHDGAGS
jgi:hypothetical protein